MKVEIIGGRLETKFENGEHMTPELYKIWYQVYLIWRNEEGSQKEKNGFHIRKREEPRIRKEREV